MPVLLTRHVRQHAGGKAGRNVEGKSFGHSPGSDIGAVVICEGDGIRQQRGLSINELEKTFSVSDHYVAPSAAVVHFDQLFG